MIKFEHVSFSFPKKDLYDDISFEIEDREHAVLIGSNGTGKSTLIKLMMNPDHYTWEGKISIADNARIGFIDQFVKHEGGTTTAFDFLAEPFRALQQKTDDICAKMAEAENMDEIYDEYQKCLDEMDAIDGYNYEVNIKKELAVAGLSEIENISVNQISGGEYKLLSIIRGMLLKPQLLIMDEPDVFLDLENVVGLIRLINSYEGTLLAITHNRLVLNQCFDKIIHLENQKLQEYPGTFAEYNDMMLEMKINMKEQVSRFDDFLEFEEFHIERMRKLATEKPDPKKGKQLRARVSYVERIKNQRGEDPFIEEHEYDFHFPDPNGRKKQERPANAFSGITIFDDTAREEFERVIAAKYGSAALEEFEEMEAQEALKAEKPEGPEEPVISVKDYSLEYDRKILSDVSFDIMKGEKVAIVGANGTGKSSLLRDLHVMLENRMPGSTGFFKQIYDGEEQTLSGGERNIQQLKALSDTEASILLLDEPTSHLDIYAQQALEKEVQEYTGTVVMVSHDFYTVTECADRIFILENGTMREMSGRAYRKSVYKQYFKSELFELERQRKEREIKINALLAKDKYEEARELLDFWH